MSRLDENRKMVADGVKRFEKKAQEIRTMADKLHKKMEQLHREAVAIRERARATRKNAEFATAQDRKRSGSQPRKTN